MSPILSFIIPVYNVCLLYTSLGLTATNIRYLDNNRDMAEELFDSRVASNMTLGEAVAVSYTHLDAGGGSLCCCKGYFPVPTWPVSDVAHTRQGSPCLLYTSRCV